MVSIHRCKFWALAILMDYKEKKLKKHQQKSSSRTEMIQRKKLFKKTWKPKSQARIKLHLLILHHLRTLYWIILKFLSLDYISSLFLRYISSCGNWMLYYLIYKLIFYVYFRSTKLEI